MGRFIKQFIFQLVSAKLGRRTHHGGHYGGYGRRPRGVKGLLIQEAQRRLLGGRRRHW